MGDSAAGLMGKVGAEFGLLLCVCLEKRGGGSEPASWHVGCDRALE